MQCKDVRRLMALAIVMGKMQSRLAENEAAMHQHVIGAWRMPYCWRSEGQNPSNSPVLTSVAYVNSFAVIASSCSSVYNFMLF